MRRLILPFAALATTAAFVVPTMAEAYVVPSPPKLTVVVDLGFVSAHSGVAGFLVACSSGPKCTGSATLTDSSGAVLGSRKSFTVFGGQATVLHIQVSRAAVRRLRTGPITDATLTTTLVGQSPVDTTVKLVSFPAKKK